MKRLSLKLGVSKAVVNKIEISEPEIIHNWEDNYRYGSGLEQYERLLMAREINYDAANMSCSWGNFQVMGEYYYHINQRKSWLMLRIIVHFNTYNISRSSL